MSGFSGVNTKLTGLDMLLPVRGTSDILKRKHTHTRQKLAIHYNESFWKMNCTVSRYVDYVLNTYQPSQDASA